MHACTYMHACMYACIRDVTIHISIYCHIVIPKASDTVLTQFKLYQYIEYQHTSNIVSDIAIHVLTLILHLYYD